MIGKGLSREALLRLLSAHAPSQPTTLCPELVAWSATDELPLWSALEQELDERIPPPFFAIAWPGAQALARAVLDGAIPVAGAIVADIGCGSGLAGIAAAKRGAARVIACDIDPLAVDAAIVCAVKNGVTLEGRVFDALANPSLVDEATVILAGDLVYNETMGAQLKTAVPVWRERGKIVVLADSGRPFFSACGCAPLLRYDVRVPRIVEGVSSRAVTVYGNIGQG